MGGGRSCFGLVWWVTFWPATFWEPWSEPLAVYLIAGSVFQSDDFVFYVDNATDHDVTLQIHSLRPITIKKLQQAGVRLKEGRKQVKTSDSYGSPLEKFILQAYKQDDGNGDKRSGYYIYNVAARNSYFVKRVTYTSKKYMPKS